MARSHTVRTRSQLPRVARARWRQRYHCWQCRVAPRVCTGTAVRGAGHNKWSNIKHIKAERDGQLAKVSIALDNYM